MIGKILVVDDNKIHLSFMQMALELAGYDTVGASSIEAAFESLNVNSIVAAVLDFDLSDKMNGLELCRKIKELPQTKTIPIIVVSGSSNDRTLIEGAFKSGAVEFIRKPFKPSALQNALNRCLSAKPAAISKELEAARQRAIASLTMNANPLVLDRCTELLNEVQEQLSDDCVRALDKLFKGLRELRFSGPDSWNQVIALCRRHPIKETLHKDPFTFRAFSKPRGYPGDAETLDFVYGNTDGSGIPKGLSGIGRGIFEYTTDAPGPRGARARRKLVITMLERIAEEVEIPRPSVLCVAAGHLTEAGLSKAVKGQRFGRFVALDWDPESLDQVKRFYAQYGVETVNESVRRLLTGKVNLGSFDFIYSLGLYDYLEQATAMRLTQRLFQMLRPGGKLLIANFLPGIHDVGYMECFMDWKLVYRTPDQMLDLGKEIPMTEFRDIRLTAEENHNIIFLQLTKARFRSEWLDFGG